MDLREQLEILRAAGVSRAKLTPEGCLLEVEFLGQQEEAAAEPAAATERPDPLGIPPAFQEAFDVFASGARARGRAE